MAGFQLVPDVLLVKQQQLGLDALDVLVLLNITSFWWFRDRPPFLRTNVIAARTGVSPRSVQRIVKKLQTMGYITRKRWADDEGNTWPAVFFDGLIAKLEELASADAFLGQRMQRALSKTNQQGLTGGEAPF